MKATCTHAGILVPPLAWKNTQQALSTVKFTVGLHQLALNMSYCTLKHACRYFIQKINWTPVHSMYCIYTSVQYSWMFFNLLLYVSHFTYLIFLFSCLFHLNRLTLWNFNACISTCRWQNKLILSILEDDTGQVLAYVSEKNEILKHPLWYW